jgi:hypothetical protein
MKHFKTGKVIGDGATIKVPSKEMNGGATIKTPPVPSGANKKSS